MSRMNRLFRYRLCERAVQNYAENFKERIFPVIDINSLEEEALQRRNQILNEVKKLHGHNEHELSHKNSDVYQHYAAILDDLYIFRKEMLLTGTLGLYHHWERYYLQILAEVGKPPAQRFSEYEKSLKSLVHCTNDSNFKEMLRSLGLEEKPPGPLRILWHISNIIKHDNFASAKKLALADSSFFPEWHEKNSDLGLCHLDEEYDGAELLILHFRGQREDDRVFEPETHPYGAWPCRTHLEVSESHFEMLSDAVCHFFKTLGEYVENRPTKHG